MSNYDFWRSKPPPGIVPDPGHPLTRGLIVCYLFNELAGNVQDCAGRITDIALRQQGNITHWNAREGGGVNVGVSASTYLRTTTQRTSNVLDDALFCGDLSLVIRGSVAAIANQDVFSKAGTSGVTVTPFDFQITAGGLLGLVRSNSAFRAHTGPTVTAGVVQTWGFSAPREIEVAPVFYLNGVAGTTATAGGTGTGAPTGIAVDLYAGIRPGDGLLQLTGTYHLIAAWNRLLSAEEHHQLAANPYAMFATPPWRKFFGAAAVPAGGARSQAVWIG